MYFPYLYSDIFSNTTFCNLWRQHLSLNSRYYKMLSLYLKHYIPGHETQIMISSDLSSQVLNKYIPIFSFSHLNCGPCFKRSKGGKGELNLFPKATYCEHNWNKRFSRELEYTIRVTRYDTYPGSVDRFLLCSSFTSMLLPGVKKNKKHFFPTGSKVIQQSWLDSKL